MDFRYFYKLSHEFLQIVAWFSTNCTFLQFFCRSQNPSTNFTFFVCKCGFLKNPCLQIFRFCLQIFSFLSANFSANLKGGKLPGSLWYSACTCCWWIYFYVEGRLRVPKSWNLDKWCLIRIRWAYIFAPTKVSGPDNG